MKRDLKEPAVQRPMVGANQIDDQQVTPDTVERFEVDRILDEEYCHGIKHLLVQWRGYDVPSWEPESNVDQCSLLVQTFNRDSDPTFYAFYAF